jgi:hypothetical protein
MIGLQRNGGLVKTSFLGQLTIKLTIQMTFFDFCLPILERCDLGWLENDLRDVQLETA